MYCSRGAARVRAQAAAAAAAAAAAVRLGLGGCGPASTDNTAFLFCYYSFLMVGGCSSLRGGDGASLFCLCVAAGQCIDLAQQL